MAIAYEINPDDRGWTQPYEINATHVRGLPGARCPVCGPRSNTGLLYPSANVELLDKCAQLTDPWPIPLDEFNRLAAKIQPILGEDRPIGPGTNLGPLKGKASGRFGDFTWVNPWTPLMRESAWLALTEAGIDIVGVRADLKFRKQGQEPLVELEALPKVTMANPVFLKPACDVCGMQSRTMPDEIILDRASFDSSIPLQRVANFTTVLIVNEVLARYIEEKKLRDVILTPVQLV